MARIVEDSDDDFPDLAEIIHRKIMPATSASSGSRLARTQNTEGDSVDSAAIERPIRSKIGASGSKSSTMKVTETSKAKPKKRILNQTSDNPLLRPLAQSTTGKYVSNSLKSSTPNFEGRRQKLVRNLSPDADIDDFLKLGTATKDLEEIQSRKSDMPARIAREGVEATMKKVIDLASDEEEYEGASRLSDFIVGDSTFLDEDSVVEAPPPKSLRRLVRGRRRPVELQNSDSEDVERRMAELNVVDKVFTESRKASRDSNDSADGYGTLELPVRALKSTIDGTEPKYLKAAKTSSKDDFFTSDVEDPFTLS